MTGTDTCISIITVPIIDRYQTERILLVFECMQCGECCSHLGLMWKITEEHPDFSFTIQNAYSGEYYSVSVPQSLRHLFIDTHIFSELPEACPFFRCNNQDGLWYCTVHLSRPDICREYGCWRFLILDPNGKRAGRVMGTRHLHAENTSLQKVWDEQVRTLKEPDDSIWDQKMCKIIQNAGFIIRD